MTKKVERITHYGPQGRLLHFDNAEGLYPVNRYQSLVLASCAKSETVAYAFDAQRPLRDLRAVEVCCGGGPAALTLKATGVGHVEAWDINPKSVESCCRNAKINDIILDGIACVDLLGAERAPDERFDIIACNAPCARRYLMPGTAVGCDIERAVDGGKQGVDLTLRLIEEASGHLVPGGLLVFVLTSTMSLPAVVNSLNERFPNRWRIADRGPVAHPFQGADSDRREELMSLRETGEVFVWRGPDGGIWRFTWVVVACNAGGNRECGWLTGLWPYSIGYEIRSRDFHAALARLRNLLPFRFSD